MGIKINLGELISKAGPSLVKIASNKFRGKIQLKMVRLLSAVRIEERLWNERRDKMIEEYKTEGDDGFPVIPDDKKAEFNKKVEEAFKDEVELSSDPLQMSDLTDYALEPLLLVAIGEMLVDDEDQKE